ncbi:MULTISPECIES: efflux RND transporter permease subunit [unclassified Chelatococcus]|uniref:efflux RND transporter permease subunit n=1 Tax=unclassified Chelatococcus TaxID=2638111 RepID=UPI001BCB19DC|nr:MULTISPECIES: efflux RND transporter permease subunit [unclassified Chelatococcus]CAH1650656.1 multidrug efflux pump RND permease AcrB [Hyphomicrobiales bacterium]MBS7739763.1 multidrug efflux RND transporter permease subunit [Chelatococcus sp. HY11]MBX3544132.1 multidrug efflux RND transporter permease subunit [Chelatococcus sp.]MCO5075701.1 multidrug efflux RND transporter permease subunit [Chelatococcus sp.]CAH1666086.1 multidrug efflux pump RND permease AcrB [Hyphomicrobiales bacterium]
MAQFFIGRPIFAWVVALFIVIGGIIAIPMLPIAQYPNVAPPQISIQTNYPGASPEEIYQSVTRPIEEELNGVPGLIYFESTSDSSGLVQITATFRPGTATSQASVDVQNAIRRVEARLPETVTRQGVQVEEAGAGFLMVAGLISTDGSMDAVALGDYVSRNVLGEIRRIDGVGRAQLFASQRAMRVWIDPDKMVGLNLTTGDIAAAIGAQNAQVAAGRIGAQPNPIQQQISATVLVKGQLTTPDEFAAIVLRANPDGSTVRLRDVARVEVGAETYNFNTRINGKPAAAIGVQLSPTGNALATSTAIRAKMEELSRFFPASIEYTIPYDTSPFVKVSIEKVLHTLLEAVALVFVVMFLFLQNFRYTIIPTLVVPVALLGTCGVMLATGFSINVLTMFAMVLAIGILVDDAIVVVENVERIMAEEGLPPLEATRKAMRQISGAIVGITLVLTAVFVPMAFFPGAVGIIYQQFSLTMVTSILLSGFLALSLTPALCATLLKPIPQGHHEKKGFFGWFNRSFDRFTNSYAGSVSWIVRRAGRFMVIYLALLVGLGWAFIRLPTSFLPNEDQGYIIVDMQAPPEASGNRTHAIIETAEKHFSEEKAVDRMVMIQGYSFSGAGDNAALSFVTLKDWSERDAGNSADAIAGRANGALFQIRDAMAFALSPPAITGLGTSSGFTFRLQDRGGLGQTALVAAGKQLMDAAAKSPVLAGLRVEGMPNAAQVNLIIDREKANTFGVTFADINSAISTNLGSSYINDFPNAGRMQRVTVQADAGRRMQTEDLLKLNVRNSAGGMVPLSAFARIDWQMGPAQVVGYNGYPAIRINGAAAPGHSSGAAIAEMERLAGELPNGFGYEWTGQSLQEIQSGSQAPFLMGLTVLFVFLLLAALYESWSIPLSVMMVVPLGVLGSVAAVMLRDMPNDVYFKVGLITIIGLSAKNAILIIEFAKDLRAEGKPLLEATIEACRLRFRPILMTSLAFTLGVVPLAIATGASAASQNAIGTGVMGGMISATLLAIYFVPVFFVFVMKLFDRRDKTASETAPDSLPPVTSTPAHPH